MKSESAVERLVRRDRLWVLLGLAGVVGLAWVYLVREAAAMDAMAAEAAMHAAMGMAGMADMTPRDFSDVLALFVMWTVMMAGMMLPSAAPVIVLVLGLYRRRGDRQARLASVTFVTGYILTWTAFSAAAAAAQVVLHRTALLGTDMRLQSAAVSGIVLLAAGIYQWLPLKNRCLTHCQSPLSFLTRYWREGPMGGLTMGMRHGAFCVGCCWALMALLFVLGVMNLLWVAALAAFVLIEKVLPRGAIVGRVAGLGAAAWGVFLLVAA